jgi:hypothetical protein
MNTFIFGIFDRLPPLKRKCNPTWALVWGFLLGGIGLGIYFRSFLDFLLLVMVALVLFSTVGSGGWIVGAAFASLWGCMRAISSNSKLNA